MLEIENSYEINISYQTNSGLSVDMPASHLVIYNNTIVNSGWRRPKIKGGSIWMGANIMLNCIIIWYMIAVGD